MPIIENVDWKQIAIDTVWFFGVTFLGGFLIAIAWGIAQVPQSNLTYLAEVYMGYSLLFITASVIFLVRKRSNTHVFSLGLIFWILGSYDWWGFGRPLADWLRTIPLIFALLFLAKFISHVLRLIYGKLSTTI